MTAGNAEMLALAARCEAATGAAFVLDQAIGAAIGWPLVPRAYTASLDAAMLLVPDGEDSAGERFKLEHWNTNGVHAEHIRASAWVAGAPRVYAATPALALCAAALRARAQEVR